MNRKEKIFHFSLFTEFIQKSLNTCTNINKFLEYALEGLFKNNLCNYPCVQIKNSSAYYAKDEYVFVLRFTQLFHFFYFKASQRSYNIFLYSYSLSISLQYPYSFTVTLEIHSQNVPL